MTVASRVRKAVFSAAVECLEKLVAIHSDAVELAQPALKAIAMYKRHTLIAQDAPVKF
jgi:hypothetical protein